MDILEQLKQRTVDGWLYGYDSAAFLSLTTALIHHFNAPLDTQDSGGTTSTMLITESDPHRFLAGFLAAAATVQHIFVANPHWGQSELNQALAIAQPDHIWGDRATYAHQCWQEMTASVPAGPDAPVDGRVTVLGSRDNGNGDRLIMIPTGGTSGQIKFAMHRWSHFQAAVAGFQDYFHLPEVNSVCVLPLYHVGGLMQCLRSLLSGGQLWLVPFRRLATDYPRLPQPEHWVISLVPTQLQALMAQPSMARWLAHCRVVFVGGAPCWPTLLDRARSHGIPLSLCYGMTETAAQVVALAPADFLAGRQTTGRRLPHAQLTIVDEQGETVSPGTPGRIQIAGPSVALGYYPHSWPVLTGTAGATFTTEDGGIVDHQGYLTVLGRLSAMIITGGENVFPTEVEAAIQATGLVQDVAVIGVPDDYWGQRVTAVYVPTQSTPTQSTPARATPVQEFNADAMASVLGDRIARYKHPKQWLAVDALPRTPHGKINRALLVQWVEQEPLPPGNPNPLRTRGC